jgi:GTP-binding protein EngB required for normal cell division
MDRLYNSLTDLSGKIPQFWNKQNDGPEYQKNLTHLATPQILEIGNVLNAIVENIDWEESSIESLQRIKLETPRVVVVGTQSSGKSSVLNGILALDMLPIGRNMVTRTPLHLQLIQTDVEMAVEFGNYGDGQWQIEKRIKLTDSEPSMLEIETIREEIEKQTIKRAGKGMGISFKEIVIKFYSPYVPNLSLIDLPGLTMVACTDKGQPKDIKEQVRQLVAKYIQPEKSLILAVMSARTDLETDMALDLVKEYDPRGKRTIGVLTKVDLMNDETHIGDYLHNNVSVDLRTQYGYYAVRNRSTREMMTMTHKQGLENESEYFSKHPFYGQVDDNIKNRLGICNLGQSLSQILINHIRKSLPELLSNLRELQSQMETVIGDLGSSIPDEEDAKIAYLNNIINTFVKQYISSLEDRGSAINVGRRLRDNFIDFRKDLTNVNPFTQDGYNQKYYENVIRDCEGNHMSLFSLPIEAPEYCLRDTEKRPFLKLLTPASLCLQNVSIELRQLIDEIIRHQHLDRFPKFVEKLREILNIEIIDPSEENTKRKLQESVDAEEGYIWTHDVQFNNELKKTVASSNIANSELLRQIVEKYYVVVRQILEHTIPKTIMLFLVKNVENLVYPTLFKHSGNLLKVLHENPEEETKRQKYRKCLKALQLANQIFEKI